MKYVSLVVLFFWLLVSCQPKKDQDKFDWNAGISAPRHYSAVPFVEYFCKGKSITGTSVGIGIDPGWGITSGGYVGGGVYKSVPDSIYVNWVCGTDNVQYSQGFKLPQNKMLELFEKGAIDVNKSKEEYNVIIAGAAPGGNVTIWMQAGRVLTEIVKFKAENNGIWKANDFSYQKHRKKIEKMQEFINSETSIFLYLHGVPYSVWEKGEKEYNYDIGFSSEDALVKPQITTFYAKDGSWYQSWIDKEADNSIDIYKWGNYDYLENNNLKKENKLPVQINLKWNLIDKDKIMHGILVMPQNLEELISKPYTDTITNKREFYSRIIIGAYRGGDKGILWLTGKNKKLKLMEFIMLDSEDKNIKSYYSLPKNFVFPKWEGREPLKIPELDYWQEK